MSVCQPDRALFHAREGGACESHYSQCLRTATVYARLGVVEASGAPVAAGIGRAHHTQCSWRVRLLHHMRELVGKQPAALCRSWGILAWRKRDMAPEREGARVKAPRRSARRRISVKAYL